MSKDVKLPKLTTAAMKMLKSAASALQTAAEWVDTLRLAATLNDEEILLTCTHAFGSRTAIFGNNSLELVRGLESYPLALETVLNEVFVIAASKPSPSLQRLQKLKDEPSHHSSSSSDLVSDSSRFARVLDSGEFADFAIVVDGDDKADPKEAAAATIRCHKAILYVRWPFFKAIMRANLKEATESKLKLSSEMGLDHDTLATVVLPWMYSLSDEIVNAVASLEACRSILAASDYYQLSELGLTKAAQKRVVKADEAEFENAPRRKTRDSPSATITDTKQAAPPKQPAPQAAFGKVSASALFKTAPTAGPSAAGAASPPGGGFSMAFTPLPTWNAVSPTKTTSGPTPTEEEADEEFAEKKSATSNKRSRRNERK
jgi:hypothetical protein